MATSFLGSKSTSGSPSPSSAKRSAMGTQPGTFCTVMIFWKKKQHLSLLINHLGWITIFKTYPQQMKA